MEWRARGIGGPQRASFPSTFRIVDASFRPFGKEAHRIRHAQGDELSVYQREVSIAGVPRRNWHVLAEAEDVEPVDPDVITRLGAAIVFHILELRTGQAIQRPSFRALSAADR